MGQLSRQLQGRQPLVAKHTSLYGEGRKKALLQLLPRRQIPAQADVQQPRFGP
jgi:hypothetical protein